MLKQLSADVPNSVGNDLLIHGAAARSTCEGGNKPLDGRGIVVNRIL